MFQNDIRDAGLDGHFKFQQDGSVKAGKREECLLHNMHFST